MNSAPTAGDRPQFVDRGFGGDVGAGRSACLLVIDVQIGFTDPKYPLGADLGAEIDRINEATAVCRRRGWPVIYTRIAYRNHLAIGKSVWARKIPALRMLEAGSELVELDPRLARTSHDDVMTKEHASAFFGTDLVSRLNAVGADSLILTGCTTSGCVRATAVDSIQYGYRPVVLADAVGDRCAVAHRQSLVDIKCKYADVQATADFAGVGRTEIDGRGHGR